MRYRNASIDYIEELGDMETTGRAVTYDNSSFADRINDFRKNYDSLPELLKKQKLNENDIRWFLQSIHWQKIKTIRSNTPKQNSVKIRILFF